MAALVDEATQLEDVDFGNPIIDLDDFERDQALKKLDILQEMFPDAELGFLQAHCADYALDTAAFEAFISGTMLRSDYPKKPVKDVVETGVIPEEPNNNEPEEFNVKEFLKKYPNPEQYFSAKPSWAYFCNHAVKFLEERYLYQSTITIRRLLRTNKYNLYLADVSLSNLTANSRSRVRKTFVTVYGFPPRQFIDAVNFIKYNNVIKEYLAAQRKIIEEARLSNNLFTCGCCFNDELLISELSFCSEGHTFCHECILRSTEIGFGNGVLDFKCLQECSGFFEASVLKEVLPKTTYEKLEKKWQEREVVSANIPGLESCPFCEYCVIPPEGTRIFDCENCKKLSCRLCKKESHIPLRCEEVTNIATRQRVFIEEKMTEALLRTCWNCGSKFIREDGCNKMNCGCGAKMCYICKQPVKNYEHFYDRNFVKGKCPLWTGNEVVHVNDVRQGRGDAIAMLQQRDPHFKSALVNEETEPSLSTPSPPKIARR